jgi:hypothetical protein
MPYPVSILIVFLHLLFILSAASYIISSSPKRWRTLNIRPSLVRKLKPYINVNHQHLSIGVLTSILSKLICEEISVWKRLVAPNIRIWFIPNTVPQSYRYMSLVVTLHFTFLTTCMQSLGAYRKGNTEINYLVLPTQCMGGFGKASQFFL